MYDTETRDVIRKSRAEWVNRRGPWTYKNSPLIRECVNEDIKAKAAAIKHAKDKVARLEKELAYAKRELGRMSNGASPSNKKGGKMKYQVHLLKNPNARDPKERLWIPLGMYRNLTSAYAKVNSTRDHYLKQRLNAKVLRQYAIYIEFRHTNMVRAFELTPEYSLNCTEVYSSKMGLPSSTSWYTPKSWVLMDSEKLRKKKNTKTLN